MVPTFQPMGGGGSYLFLSKVGTPCQAGNPLLHRVGGLLGPRAVRVSGTAETEYTSGKPAV